MEARHVQIADVSGRSTASGRDAPRDPAARKTNSETISEPISGLILGILARQYGFTHEVLDFIINYDIKYRMGRGGDDEVEE
jgi:hypothetical protein